MKYRVQNIVNNEYLDDDGIFLLPNGEVGWFIRDGSYPHYRKFGYQEDFKVINEDCERLQKQLDIALSSMRDSRELLYQLSQILAADAIGKQLKEIKELNK